MHLSEIHIYPVKSLRGISPAFWSLDSLGLAQDRRWMLVDDDGSFVTQRRQARMALVDTALQGDRLWLRAPAMADLCVAEPGEDAERMQTRVWRDQVRARYAGVEAADWLSEFLGESVRLVHFPDGAERPVDPCYAAAGDRTAFADGFPLLLISEASLADLNARLAQPLPMRRFRPNLVIGGTEPYAEDRWSRIRIGETTFRVVKPCSRCVITTIDPETGVRGKEPLATLARYRRLANDVFFGQNLIHDGIGTLRLGDPVEVLGMQ